MSRPSAGWSSWCSGRWPSGSPPVLWPEPNVESAVVDIRRHDPPAADRDWLFRLVAAGFGQRRKMLRRSLAELVPAEGFEAAGIRPDARAEELGVEDWG